MAYAAGEGVPGDNAEAIKWFRKAASQGDAGGEYSLGEMYLTGRGVAADDKEAAIWIRRSAKHGGARGSSTWR